jgi:hypothetical protein
VRGLGSAAARPLTNRYPRGMRRLATLALIAACGRSAHAPPPAPSNTPAPTVVEPEPVALPAPSLGDDRPAPGTAAAAEPAVPRWRLGQRACRARPRGTSTQLTADHRHRVGLERVPRPPVRSTPRSCAEVATSWSHRRAWPARGTRASTRTTR